jgi:hypothetical protein
MSDDLRDQFSALVETTGQLSRLAHLRDMLATARQSDAKRCGNCFFWMKSSLCPQERNVNGRNHGPSMNSPACGKFQIEQRAIDLKARRLAEAREFAIANDLQVPSA